MRSFLLCDGDAGFMPLTMLLYAGSQMVVRAGREGHERKYEYNGKQIVLAAIGTNGFLVTAYPNG